MNRKDFEKTTVERKKAAKDESAEEPARATDEQRSNEQCSDDSDNKVTEWPVYEVENEATENKADETSLGPKIVVVGVGGAGGNAVDNMIRSDLEGVVFVAANTDAQSLRQSEVDEEHRIQLGTKTTQGLGAGSKPDVGRAAAEESIEEIAKFIKGANMVFVTAGMGGGTGTGAAPVIARVAREAGALVVGVVTRPFAFEGSGRAKAADSGIAELQQHVDTLLIIPNQNLFRLATESTTFADAFKMADDVLYSGVRGVTDLMIEPGLINLDFADIRTVMVGMGKAMMGTGEATGSTRATDAAEAAISNPLLDDVSLQGAHGVLINITGGYDMTLYEVDEAANRIRSEVDTDANIIFGSTFDTRMDGRMRVSVVATGIGGFQDIMIKNRSVSDIVGVGKKDAGSRTSEGGAVLDDRQTDGGAGAGGADAEAGFSGMNDGTGVPEKDGRAAFFGKYAAARAKRVHSDADDSLQGESILREQETTDDDVVDIDLGMPACFRRKK